jgi:hypothetical protein
MSEVVDICDRFTEAFAWPPSVADQGDGWKDSIARTAMGRLQQDREFAARAAVVVQVAVSLGDLNEHERRVAQVSAAVALLLADYRWVDGRLEHP